MKSTQLNRLPDDTSLGRVRLKISDLERSLAFYTKLLGLHVVDDPRPGMVALAANPESKEELLILEEVPGARPQPRGTTGLYHFALLVPNRRELARLLNRLANARWPFQGFSDHGVSEALYLPDPDGNGIELYADRPRDQWPSENGKLTMYTRPLDLDNLIAELAANPEQEREPLIHPGTIVGHIHLHVSDLGRAEQFYSHLLGFDVIVRGYPGALFLSAGGYHHHLGVNTWAGEGAPPPPQDSVGLVDFEIRIPGEDAARSVVNRLKQGGLDIHQGNDNSWLVRDYDGTEVLLTTRTNSPG